MDKENNIKHAREWIVETEEMFSKRGKAPEMPILSIPKLDHFLWGLHRKELTMIGARPSNGKSILAIQLAWDMAKQGKNVYFMSLEMASPRIMERIFTYEYCIDNSDIWKGAVRTDAKIAHKWDMFKKQIANTKLIISDMIGRTAQDLETIEKAFSKHPDVIIIDHLNEISSEQNKFIAIEQYLSKIREMAIRRNVALVLCCQVNRSSRTDEDKTPQLHQLKGSGSIEEKADNVILLHYPYLYDKSISQNELHIIVAKNRYGATGYGKVHIYPQYSRISDNGNISDNGVPDEQQTFGERQPEVALHNAVIRDEGQTSKTIENIKPEDIVWTE